MKTNLSYLQEMAAGNTELIKEMLGIFCDQAYEFSDGMEDLLKKGEYELLGKLAHKAKSSVAILGLSELAEELKRLELMAKSGKHPDKYAEVVAFFKQETTGAVAELRHVLNNLDIYLNNKA